MNATVSPLFPLRFIVIGSSGRMGRMLIRGIEEHPKFQLCAALEKNNSNFIGQDAGIVAEIPNTGITITSDALDILSQADGILDFSSPEASVYYAQLAAQARLVHIIGTTGFSEEQIQSLKASARHARIVQSGNMSLGINLLAALVRKTACILDNSFDIEIVEMHHRKKVDAPSGTAYLLGEAAASGRDIQLKEHQILSRVGCTGERAEGSIGFATLRGGNIIGEHKVIFAGTSERIELAHKAEDRNVFVQGALRAALWAYPQKPGFYSMNDVLDLNSI